MPKTAHFKVDPRLATLLGENYRSTELAIKELVDNAYDADAEKVVITLPEPFTNDPITVEDNGSGMTELEVREEYLKVANSRFSRKGERTLNKKRLVKGRKGIGKFAGLMVAEQMEVRSAARGTETTLTVSRSALSKADYDLEKINLPIETSDVKPKTKTGTTIILSGINDNLNFPNPEKLKQILVLEYGRSADFQLIVNGEAVGIENIPGETISDEVTLPVAGKVEIKFTVSNKPLRQSGLIIRVKEKMVGRPHFFGLEEADEVPKKLLLRVFGEVVADKLEDDVTADWGAIIENSKALAEIAEYVRGLLSKTLETTYEEEVQLSKTRLKKKINKGLERLPEYRRAFAKKALDKVLLKFFGESEEKVGTVISVLLETFEKDDYSVVLDNLEKNKTAAAEKRSDSLVDFGQIDRAMMIQQAQNRMKVVDAFEQLVNDNDATEEQVQQILSKNLWMLSSNYALMTSSPALQTVVHDYLAIKYKGKKLPELLFLKNYNQNYLLIEFKKPARNLSGTDFEPAAMHRTDINRFFPNSTIESYVLGKKLKVGVSQKDMGEGVGFVAYSDLVSEARRQLQWQIDELAQTE